MSYQYIILVAGGGDERAQKLETTASQLSRMGMAIHALSPKVTVCVSPTTPILRIGPGALVIGQVFPRTNESITDVSQFPSCTDTERLRRHFIDNFWGDYLLLVSQGLDHLALSRDPAGGIQLLYSLDGDRGFATSDIGLAFQLGLVRKRIDWDYIAHRLVFPSLKTTRTGLDRIRELLPGHTLTIGPRQNSTSQDWSPWDFVARSRRHTAIDIAARDVRAAVESAVRAYTSVDQSILLELSGGLDSSIVAACLRGIGANVSCSTITTPVPGADEQMYAKLIARHIGADLEVHSLDFEKSCFSFKQTAEFTTPRIGVLHHATDAIMEAAAAKHETASLYSGGGGDSIFCYLPTAAPAADALRERGIAEGLESVRDLAELHNCTFWKSGRLALRKLVRQPRPPCKPNLLFLDRHRAATSPELHPWFDAPPHSLPGDRERIFGLATTQVYRDSVARGQRRHFRLPLLSQPVMEACLGAPAWMWIFHGRNRSLARHAFADVLPPEILNRRSKGTFRPFLGIYYARNRHRILEYLLNGHLRSHGLLDAHALERFTDTALPARDRSFSRVLDLCATENWLQHHA